MWRGWPSAYKFSLFIHHLLFRLNGLPSPRDTSAFRAFKLIRAICSLFGFAPFSLEILDLSLILLFNIASNRSCSINNECKMTFSFWDGLCLELLCFWADICLEMLWKSAREEPQELSLFAGQPLSVKLTELKHQSTKEDPKIWWLLWKSCIPQVLMLNRYEFWDR